MPRHPPFALRNLKSHELKKATTPRKAQWRPLVVTRHPHAPKNTGASDLRCSRPLCSSQQTARTPTPTSTSRLQRRPEETIPPHRSEDPRNGVRSLRTQQRARTQPADPDRSNPRRGVLNQNPWPGCLCQCSTHEQPADTFGLTRHAWNTQRCPDAP